MPDPQHARQSTLTLARARLLGSVMPLGRREPEAGPEVPEPAVPGKRRRWWHRRRPAGSVSLPLLLVILGLGIAAAAFFILFITVYGLLSPYMGWHAMIVPIAGEIAFAYLFITGVYLAIRKLPSGILRPVMMAALMAGSVVLQVWAARHSVPDATGHLVVVAGFFGIMLVGKSTILSVLGGKVKPDRIGIGQWLAHPVHSARLWRWQQSWGESSRRAADARYRVLLYAITVAQADERVGRAPFRWRRSLPPTLRYELSMGTLDCDAGAGRPGWQEQVGEHVSAHLSMLPPAQSEGDSDEHAESDSSRQPATTGDAAGRATGNATPQRQETRQPKRQMTAAERDRARAKAGRLMQASPGLSAARVAARCGVDKRTVERWRREGDHSKPLAAVQ